VQVVLTQGELAELDRQAPSTRSRGGWQNLMVGLQMKVNRRTLKIELDDRDLERIARYAFNYNRGGWQARLVTIFGRTLGPTLGAQRLAA
jgi:hypothetical protein